MSDYIVTTVRPNDERMMKEVRELLKQEGLRPEKNPDLISVAINEDGDAIATGSLHGKTLRCMAVSSKHRGEGVLNSVVSFLVQEAFGKGLSHLFLCTKSDTATFFRDIGFYDIASVPGRIAFLENKRNGFSEYLAKLLKETHQSLAEREMSAAAADARFADAAEAPATAASAPPADSKESPSKPISAIVLNANPFTLGHLALIEKASSESQLLHLFVVSEDASLFPYAVRRRLIEEGCAHLNNVLIHDSGAYLLSAATFPSYFQKDEEDVTKSHAHLDAAVFLKIAKELGITRRYVGEEEASHTTKLYNGVLREVLPKEGVELFEIPRKCEEGRPISASTVRSLIHDDPLVSVRDSVDDSVNVANPCAPLPGAPLSEKCLDKLKALLPPSTIDYLKSEEASPVLAAIRLSHEVVHH